MEFGPELVDIGGRRLNAIIRGEGPLLILEGGGMQAGTTYAPRLVPALAKVATVLTYDRAGLGASDPPEGPRTAGDMADDLFALLGALKLEGKAVLVGYSLSGLIVQIFAARHPEHTAGLVLFDPTPADTFEPTGHRMTERPDPSKFKAPSQLEGAAKLEVSRMRESCEQVRAVEVALPKVPTAVVTVGKRGDGPMGEVAMKIMSERHQRLADLVSGGKLIVAANSEHATIWQSDPSIAMAAIKDVIARAF